MEPTITINGRTLSEGEAMAVRVAVTSLHTEMNQPKALGDDDMGKAIALGYARTCLSVLHTMLQEGRQTL